MPLRVYDGFEALREGFLDPLSKRGFERTTIPLSGMKGWKIETCLETMSADELDELIEAAKELRLTKSYKGFEEDRRQAAQGRLADFILSRIVINKITGRYTIEGWRCQPDNNPELWDVIPPNAGWDQPGATQPSGIIAQIIDLEGNALVRAIWEPGNFKRGWNGSALLLDASAKHSPGNKALWESRGATPPLADFVDDLLSEPMNVVGRIEKAPYDGARDDKSNLHALLCAERAEIEKAVGGLGPKAQERYALIAPGLLSELIEMGLVPIHLRDLLSLRP